jgi:hypothetical protein
VFDTQFSRSRRRKAKSGQNEGRGYFLRGGVRAA